MPPRKSKPTPVVRNVALCYVRLSYTRDESDKDSPERQRANIQIACEQHGWKMEWYEDIDGHKTGTKEKNRPGWLALKKRLEDPDVVALVANDLSRLHRKSWRVGDLVDFVQEHDITLVLAAPGRQIDTSTPMGQMFAMLASIFDEYYAKDLSIRQKDSIAHRKRQGKAINLPFGTKRRADGYLAPSVLGAWLMPDGQHKPGKAAENPPDDAALWRSYFDCAKRILELYAENKYGADRIAYMLNLEGWVFKNRDGLPRPLDKEDVRRVVYNWPEYGGVVLGKKARYRSTHEFNPDAVQLNPDRALFPIDLLIQVGRVSRERALEPRNQSVKRTSRTYAMNGMLYCAHCEQRALQQENPDLCSKLWGKTSKDSRYRHRDGSKGCGCTNRSVTCEEVENDFGRLLHLMIVREEVIKKMVNRAAEASGTSEEEVQSRRTQKQEVLARCQRRIQAARRLFKDGDIDEAEYDKVLRECEQEIEAWNQMTGEQEQVEYELKMCVESLSRLAALWDSGDAEQRQGIVRSLFNHIVYDLDARRIVNFKLKPWAERFLELRVDAEIDGLNPSSVRWPRRESNPRHSV
jgi:DNA invertase Pin-like site-specific DNA recombinase